MHIYYPCNEMQEKYGYTIKNKFLETCFYGRERISSFKELVGYNFSKNDSYSFIIKFLKESGVLNTEYEDRIEKKYNRHFFQECLDHFNMRAKDYQDLLEEVRVIYSTTQKVLTEKEYFLHRTLRSIDDDNYIKEIEKTYSEAVYNKYPTIKIPVDLMNSFEEASGKQFYQGNFDMDIMIPKKNVFCTRITFQKNNSPLEPDEWLVLNPEGEYKISMENFYKMNESDKKNMAHNNLSNSINSMHL